ncbi:transglycosylase SLT domain-containing protein [Pseudoalteromonas peptidolytica]|uniref:Soluble lytic murein transglycosylase n=1 Tax=Pseudoalteromonas peptidolytica F12-50-A1 TaxID=1315280 RepID=A0A8I0MSF5_9GAMM|nr:transglycosylase SLT domain-containing protein [Pseudoalteromonas peptidolytica]MBE0344578.1 soluble lytic murein transglycosylase [Pseudoalteromonas peptidolytica F12-50-A1]NLR15179.1 transglycosylase SLT domain-containing protein [Pseudoalteromonas peptidolytica]GEK10524.1 lytic transglycosylase [Pseudoalteromonas peptidolytica]
MTHWLRRLAVGSLCFVSCLGAAQSTHDEFKQAERIAWSGNYNNFTAAIAQLDHPLKPYVEMAFYQRHPRLKYQQEIQHFLTIYEHTPLEWPVRSAWLEYLKRHKKKARFIEFYRETSDVELKCTYLSYQLDLGAPKKAILDQVADIWTVGKSQPRACDGLFRAWQKAGYRTSERVWQRVSNAAQSGQTSLLDYLQKLLPKHEAYLAQLYKTVRQDPSAAAGLYRFKKRTVKESEIAVYGVRRLIWRDPDLALRAWQKMQNMFSFSQQQKDSVAYRFALALASKGHKDARFWLNKVPKSLQDKKLLQWLMSNMLKEQDWEGISALFVGHEQLSNAQQYWLAFSLSKRGDIAGANVIWQQLAKERDYYGFLAAARLGLPVSLNELPLEIDAAIVDQVSQAPGFKRAKALYELERYTQARREWNYLTNTSSKDEKLAASVLAAEFDWYDSTIFTLAQIKAWDYVDLRFPMAFKDLFSKYSKRHRVDLAWSIAIARRESSFAPDARSSADAHGLMQLLPSTAKYVNNRKRVTKKRLYQPATNIRLGTSYLEYLKRKNAGNEILATASYNAGYHRIKRWLPSEAMPAELWIELIPYKETRDYVKNVMAYRQVYHTRLGRDGNILADILEMKIVK